MKYLKVVFVILIALGVVFLSRRYLGHSPLPQRPPMGGEAMVVVTNIGMRHFTTRVEAMGTAYASESVTITAPVAERVSKVLFADGTTVKAGDLLVQLEDAEESADVEEAMVNLDEQRRELGRIKALRDKMMVSEQEMDTRRSAAEAAQARLAAAQARLRDRAIMAPFAGVLGIRRVSLGALVAAGTAITTLDDLDLIKADFTLPETLFADIAIGQTIEARSVAWPDGTFTGTVVTIDTRVNPTTRAVTVQAHIPNPQHRIRPGMLLTVSLISRLRESLCVPEKALLAYGDKHYAFVLKSDNTVEQRELRLGEREVGWVEIEDGLKDGESIVTEGLMDLKDKVRVRVAGMPPSAGIVTPGTSSKPE